MTQALFLSYARSDGEAAANALRRRLAKRPGLAVWQDLTELEGGSGWWEQVRAAIDGAAHLLLVLTPAALRSEVVLREWRYARQEGVCVVPVQGAGLAFDQLPWWIRRQHIARPAGREQFERLVRTLQGPCRRERVPLMLAELPDDHVPRPRIAAQALAALVSKKRGEPKPGVVALVGAGGYGKSTLADALGHDPRIQEAWAEGMLRVRLGPAPDVAGRLADLVQVLSGTREGTGSIPAAMQRLAELIEQRAMLIVVDDVWHAADCRPFLHGGPRCARLVTTRDAGVLPPGATRIAVDAMDDAEARELLVHRLPPSPAFEPLLARLGAWPLLLKLVGATLRDLVHAGRMPIGEAIGHALSALAREGPAAFDADDPRERSEAVSRTLALGLDRLAAPLRESFLRLAVLPPEVRLPLADAARLWGCDGPQAVDVARRLRALSLLADLDLAAGTLRLHDVLRETLVRRAGRRLPGLHRRFLAAAGVAQWLALPAGERYLWRHLGHHLRGAGQAAVFDALRTDGAWLTRKLANAGLPALLADFREAEAEGPVARVGEALALAADALAQDPAQLAGQLCGRLAPAPGERDGPIAQLLDGLRHAAPGPWLRPLAPSLDPPGGALLQSIAVDRAGLHALAFTPDDRRLLVGGWRDVAVWAPAEGRIERRHRLHPGRVDAVIALPDGRGAVSTGGGVLRAWQIASGALRFERPCPEGAAIAVDPEGAWIAVPSRSGRRIVLVDPQSGERRLRLEGLGAPAQAIVLGCEAGRVVRLVALGHENSGSKGGAPARGKAPKSARDRGVEGDSADPIEPGGPRLLAWALPSGACILDTADPPGRGFRALAADRAARRIVTIAPGALMIRDLHAPDPAAARRVAEGPAGPCALDVDPAGEVAAVLDGDGGVRTIGLDDGRARWQSGAPDAEPWRLGNAALRIAGGIVVSTAGRLLLRCHDLATGAPLAVLRGHYDGIESLAVAHRGNRLASGAAEGVAKLWRLDRAGGPAPGDAGYVHAAAIDRAGTIAATAGEGGRIALRRVAEPRQPPLMLDGHNGLVGQLAFTPDGRSLVSTGYDRTVRFWTLAPRPRLRATGTHGDRVLALALAPDGRAAYTGGDDRVVRAWDPRTGRALAVLAGHRDRVNALALDAAGHLLASASEDGTVRLWARPGHRGLDGLRLPGPAVLLALDAAGERISVAYGIGHSWAATELGVWQRPPEGPPLASFALRPHRYALAALAFSADGRWVATASEDGEIVLRDAAGGAVLATVPNAHRGRIGELMFAGGTPTALVSGGHDHRLRIWRVPGLEPLCGWTGEGKVVALAGTDPARAMVVGEAGGGVHLLVLEPGEHAVPKEAGGTSR